MAPRVSAVFDSGITFSSRTPSAEYIFCMVSNPVCMTPHASCASMGKPLKLPGIALRPTTRPHWSFSTHAYAVFLFA